MPSNVHHFAIAEPGAAGKTRRPRIDRGIPGKRQLIPATAPRHRPLRIPGRR